MSPNETVCREPRVFEVFTVVILATAFILLTRLPTSRPGPLETDEFGFLESMSVYWFSNHHTLYLALSKAIGWLIDDRYAGMQGVAGILSVLSIAATWWFLRGLVAPQPAAWATLCLAVAPVFWVCGSIANNYSAIPAFSGLLLGLAIRPHRAWHPVLAGVVFAIGAGFRQDIGLFWFPVFGCILWKSRRQPLFAGAGLLACLSITAIWFGLMLVDMGGWSNYRAKSGQFMNHLFNTTSVFTQGPIQGTLRCGVKLAVALFMTLGFGLLAWPRGVFRLIKDFDRSLILLASLSILPALFFHLCIHFGVAGYALHYAVWGTAFLALGIAPKTTPPSPVWKQTQPRLAMLASLLAAWFWFHPAHPNPSGLRKDFELVIGRHSRSGLQSVFLREHAQTWKTPYDEINTKTH